MQRAASELFSLLGGPFSLCAPNETPESYRQIIVSVPRNLKLPNNEAIAHKKDPVGVAFSRNPFWEISHTTLWVFGALRRKIRFQYISMASRKWFYSFPFRSVGRTFHCL